MTTQGAPSFRDKSGWPGAVILCAAVFWVYAPVLQGGWLWDDRQEVADNAALRTGRGLVRLWLGRTGPDYFPLKSTVQWLQWHAWGGGVEGYHLTNIVLHAASVVLLWRLFRRLGIGMAWAGALWYGVHPVAVESVAWIAELKNTLSLPLLLLASEAHCASVARGSLAGLRGAGRGEAPCREEAGRRHWRRVALAAFAAAMLCKSSVVMFPAVLLLFAWWRRGRVERDDLRHAAPFFLVSLVLGLVTLWRQNHRALRVGMSLLSRVADAGMALGFYVRKCVWPAGLMPVYPRWSVSPPPLAGLVVWIAVILLGLGIWRGARAGSPGARPLRAIGLGGGFFLLMVAPVLGFLPMAYQHFAWVADHLVYVPLIGCVGLAAAALSLLHDSRLRWGAALGIAAVLAGASRREARIFDGPGHFWTVVTMRNPDAVVGRINLGQLDLEQGRLPEALVQLHEAVRLGPDQPEAHNDYASALAMAGDLTGALEQAQAAVRLKPDYPEAHNNLGLVLLQSHQPAEAIAEFEAAVRLRPDFEAAQKNLRDAREIQTYGPGLPSRL